MIVSLEAPQVGEMKLTTSSAARYLGVSVSTVQRWVELGVLKSDKTAGGHRRISM